jgi:hypothetical protein
MSSKKQKKLELDYETADKITVLCLKDAYLSMNKEVKEALDEIKNNGELPVYKKEDLVYNQSMMIHIREVLKYYGEGV